MQITAALVKELRERTGAGMMECKKALVETEGDVDKAIENMRKSGQAKADKKAGRVAAEGLVAIASEDAGTAAAMVEVNCETDFVAKEDEFKEFVTALAQRALTERCTEAAALSALPLEAAGGITVEERRRDLVAKIGENMSVRRVAFLEAPAGGLVGGYLHGGRIGVVVALKEGTPEVAKDIAMHVAASDPVPVCIAEDDVPPEMLEKEKEIFTAQAVASGKPPEIAEKMTTGRLKKFLKEITLLGQPFVKDPDLSVEKFLANANAGVAAFERFAVGEGIEKKAENFAEEVMATVRETK